MSLSHSSINLTNLDLSAANEAPVSKAVLAVWYSSSLMHALLQKRKKIINGKQIKKFSNYIMEKQDERISTVLSYKL